MATRHERVIIDLDDRFSRGAAGMAANVSLFRRNLDAADGSLVKFDRHTTDVGRNIDKLSGRLGLFIDLAATLGPALIPTAAAAVPLLAGLTNQLGFAAIAGGSTILAFQGVGDALKAVNEQALNPSAENLEKVREAMATLSPAAQDFVKQLQSIRPEMQALKAATQEGLFPGMSEGLDSLMTRMPEAERILSTVSDTVGDLLAEAGDSLAGPQWDEFFGMLESQARPTLMALGESIGNVTRGLAEMWIAFAPLNRDFSSGMLEASESFAEWADGLSETQGFADFMAYLEETGPQVRDALSAIGGALLDVLKAAAPLGGPALAAIEAFGNAISAIANSDIGTPLLAAIAAFRAYSMAASVAGRATKSFVGSQAIAMTGFGSLRKDMGSWLNFGAMSRAEMDKQRAAGERVRGTFLKGAAGAGALAIATTGIGDSMGIANTAMLGLTGSMLGPVGAATGAAIGAFLDLREAGEPLSDTLTKINAAAAAGDWDAMAAGIASVKAQIADLRSTSEGGGWLSDWKKTVGGVLQGDVSFGFGGPQMSKGAGKEIRDAETSSIYAGREKAAAGQARVAAAAAAAGAAGFKLTAAGAREAAGGIREFTAAWNAATATMNRQGAWDNYRRSLLDAKDALAETGPALRKNGQIIKGQGRDVQRLGLDQRDTLRNMANGVKEFSTQMKDVGRRNQFLRESRRDFVQLAQGMGMSRQAARGLANDLGLIPRTTKPKVEEQGAAASRKRIADMRKEIQQLKSKTVKADEKGASAARARIAQLRAAIASLQNKTVTTTLITRRINRGASGNVGAGPAADAFASGGYTGDGRKYEPAGIVHRGEFVFSKEATEGHLPMLDALHRQLRGYAEGGFVGYADGGLVSARKRKHRDDNDDEHGGVRQNLKRLRMALRDTTKALEKERDAREAIIGKRNDLSSTVRGAFTSDIFATDGDQTWMSAAQRAAANDPLAKLKMDITNANAFQASLRQLARQGLNGDALGAIAATGNIGQAQALLGTGRAGVGQFEALFNQRARAAGAAGTYAGAAAYGAQIAAQTKDIRAMAAHAKALNTKIDKLEKAIDRHGNKVVSKGKASKRSGAATIRTKR